jgi:hypothetical protein
MHQFKPGVLPELRAMLQSVPSSVGFYRLKEAAVKACTTRMQVSTGQQHQRAAATAGTRQQMRRCNHLIRGIYYAVSPNQSRNEFTKHHGSN